jgi:hypothetical protein
MPFRGARRGGRTGAGGTVFWNDTGLSAQCVCSARTTPGMAAQWRTDYIVPEPDSRAVSVKRLGEDSSFDYGAPVY